MRAAVVYIAGPITGRPNYRDMFGAHERMLREAGYTVLNPAMLPDGLDYEHYMAIDFEMIRGADMVAMLPGWEDSDGAAREYHEAMKLGKRVCMVRQLERHADAQGTQRGPVLNFAGPVEAFNQLAEASEAWNPEPSKVMSVVAVVLAAFVLIEAIAWML